jgi:hemerythrin
MAKWSEALAIGHAEIDAQHRSIVEHMHTIVREIVGEPPDVIAARAPVLVKYLAEHFATHFAAEELLMEEIKYPGLSAHRIEHRGFYERFRDALARVENEKDAVSVLILVTIAVDWIGTHVLTTDARFVAFIRARESGQTAG